MKQTNDVKAFGFGGGKPVSNRTLRKFRARRRHEPGFPWEGTFKTLEEVKQYLAGDKITCLLCGRTFRKLGIHLGRIHGISDEKYKSKFGIPWSYGLACSDTSNLHREKAFINIDELAQFRHLAHAAKQRRICEAVAHQCRLNGRKSGAKKLDD